jgi:outer membrane protein
LRIIAPQNKKLMKFLHVIFLLFCITAWSQTKTGTIDIDYVLGNMPALVEVQKEVDTYSQELEADLKKKVDAYKSMVETYNTNEATLTDAVKKEKQTEIITAESDITKFRQNGAQLISLKQEELMQPLYQQVGTALEKVAKTQGYTQVLTLDNGVAYFEPAHDLSNAVLKEMGITVPTN